MTGLLLFAAVCAVVTVIAGIGDHLSTRAARPVTGPAAAHPHPTRPPVYTARHAAPRTEVSQ